MTLTRIGRNIAIATLIGVSVVGAACKSNDSKSSAPKARTTSESGAPKITLATKADGLKVGLLVSSSGPGGDVKDLAAGAYVAAFRLNGATDAKDEVALIVADDNGTAEGAAVAMQSMADQGVAGVVYASTGDHLTSGVAKAAELGLPVVLPYADDPGLKDAGATSFLTGPTIPQVAAEFAAHLSGAGRSKVALVRQAGSYGDAGKAALTAAGVDFASDTPFTPGTAFNGKGVTADKPDAVIVWTEAAPALAVADGLSVAGFGGELLFADRAAVPSFGKTLATALAASVGDGALSVGPWAGANTPGDSVDAFFLARDKAVSDGGVTADLGVADFRSHDAVLAIVAAAGESTERGKTLDGMRAFDVFDAEGVAGVAPDFSSAHALRDDDVALLTYSTLDDGSGRYPVVATSGGHWLAVTGTFETPEALKGLDNPYGG